MNFRMSMMLVIFKWVKKKPRIEGGVCVCEGSRCQLPLVSVPVLLDWSLFRQDWSQAYGENINTALLWKSGTVS